MLMVRYTELPLGLYEVYINIDLVKRVVGNENWIDSKI